jgi:hypothetical protein
MRIRFPALAGMLMTTSMLACMPVCAQQYISNGNFETGTFAGWTQTNQDNGSFLLLAPGSDTPAVAPDITTFFTAPNPAGGAFFAVSASGNPGTHALLQNFTVLPGAGHLSLSFQMFVNDQSGVGPIVDPSGLDNRTGGSTPTRDNEHARVDILTAGAADFSTDPVDVVDNLYLGVDNPGGITPNAYTDYTFDLTSVLTPGSAYRLRFATVDNLGSINLGVDNISLLATTTPEPDTTALFAGLLVTGSLLLRRRRK